MVSRRAFVRSVGGTALATTVVTGQASASATPPTPERLPVAEVSTLFGTRTATVHTDGDGYDLEVQGWFSSRTVDLGQRMPLFPVWNGTGTSLAYTVDGDVYTVSPFSGREQHTSGGETPFVRYDGRDLHYVGGGGVDTQSVDVDHPLIEDGGTGGVSTQDSTVVVDVTVGPVDVLVDVQTDPVVEITVLVVVDDEVIVDLVVGPFSAGDSAELVASTDQTETVVEASSVPGATPVETAERLLTRTVADDVNGPYGRVAAYYAMLAWAHPAVPAPLPGGVIGLRSRVE